MKKSIVIYSALGLIVIGIGLLLWNFFSKSSNNITYKTETVTKGNLVTSISTSGTISSSNSSSITTQVSGTVKKVYVNDSDTVAKDQKIAEIELDDTAQQKKTSLYSTYLSAVSALEQAEQNKLSLESQIKQNESAVYDAQDDVDYKNNNSTNPATKEPYTDNEKSSIDLKLEQAKLSLELTQKKYDESDTSIKSAKSQVSSALLNYQNYSSTIIAPAAGKLTGFTLKAGDTISSSSSSTTTSSGSTTGSATGSSSSASSSSSTTIGQVLNDSNPLQGSISLTETDIVKVKKDQQVNVTIDALSSEKIYSAKVISIDTTGTVSSGVTTYTATIEFSDKIDNAYTNMNLTAEIIISTKNDVMLVPSTAVTTANGISTVQVMDADNSVKTIAVEIGDTNDTQTEIKSGLNVGDKVVTQTIDNSTSSKSSDSSSTGTSVFGSSNKSNSSSNRGSGSMPAGGPPGM